MRSCVGTAEHRHAAIGDQDEALRWMERGLEDRGFMIPIGYSPYFRALRGDPRLHDLARRVGVVVRPGP